jgi:CheY-like chemotaxis protein
MKWGDPTMRPLNKITYVDDEPDLRTVFCAILQKIGGIEVQACDCGREALECAPAFAPDLIVLDVMMPGMDGPAVFEKLQQLPELCDTPVIFMTAKAQAAEIAALIELGAVAVITKPFRTLSLPAQIESIWAKCGQKAAA